MANLPIFEFAHTLWDSSDVWYQSGYSAGRKRRRWIDAFAVFGALVAGYAIGTLLVIGIDAASNARQRAMAERAHRYTTAERFEGSNVTLVTTWASSTPTPTSWKSSITPGSLNTQSWSSTSGVVRFYYGTVSSEDEQSRAALELRRLPPLDEAEQIVRRVRAEGFAEGWERGLAVIRLIKRNELKLKRPLTQEEIDAITDTAVEDANQPRVERKSL